MSGLFAVNAMPSPVVGFGHIPYIRAAPRPKQDDQDDDKRDENKRFEHETSGQLTGKVNKKRAATRLGGCSLDPV